MRQLVLANVRDYGGFKYREIIKLPEFATIKLSSLGKIYRDAKHAMAAKNAKVK